LATGQSVDFSTPQPAETAAKWLAYGAASVLVGSLVLWFLVWVPALRMVESGERARLIRAVGGRVLTLAAMGAAVLVCASVAGAWAQLTKSTGQSLGASLAPGTLGDFFLTTRAGSIWLLRLALALAALVVTLPPAIRARRGISITVTGLATPAFLGVVLGANVLLAMSLLSHAAASALWPAVAVAIDWMHLLAMAVWIGGLVCLVRTVPLITRGEETPGLLREVVGRFSDVAILIVGALLLTGLYASWLHLGDPASLLSTDYGHALTLKLACFAVLIALGAFNLWWVRPHLMEDGLGASVRQFRGAIAVEVALGTVVLLVTATLTGLAPSREVRAASVSPLAQTSRVDDLTTILTLSTLTPGPITYDALVTRKQTLVPDASQVAFRFSSPELGVEETERIAENGGGGHYVVSGPLTTLPGVWHVQVIVSRVGRDNVNGTFTLPIGGSLPPSPAASSRPTVNTDTVIAAIAIALAVIAAFIGAAWFARRVRSHQALSGRVGIRLVVAIAGALAFALLLRVGTGQGGTTGGTVALLSPTDVHHRAETATEAPHHGGGPLSTFVAAPTPPATICGSVELQGNALANSTVAHQAANCFRETYRLCTIVEKPSLVVRVFIGTTAEQVHYIIYAYSLAGTADRCTIDVLRTEGTRSANKASAAAAVDYEQMDRSICSGLQWDSRFDTLELTGCSAYGQLSVPLK